ncbi:BrxA family protein [Methanoculleus frigidifontis]|nr:BrxA family protein [Methanoculleus sp. FWC-SCC1]
MIKSMDSSPSSFNQQNNSLQYRDTAPYCARNLIGALLRESEKVFALLSAGEPLENIREQATNGTLFSQKALLSRKRFWNMLSVRYFQLPDWVINDLIGAYRVAPHSAEFTSLLYVHYALRDHLTFDFITQRLWSKWNSHQLDVSPDDILKMLDESAESEPQIATWTDATRERLSTIILSSLRDFGVLSGKQKKRLTKPVLPLFVVEHILHILTAEGVRGNTVLKDPIWRLFLCTDDEIAHYLQQLGLNRRIHFERVGETVVLQTPAEWESPE